MSALLDRIDSPAQLRGLSYLELQQLAAEIRAELIACLTENGGHLASNLGAVELALAVHRVFCSPVDRIVWDVGHQTGVHKLLTGRRQQFQTIRKYGGLSGFPDRAESPHDVFGTGHSSTSISAILGMAIARDLRGETHETVAVIGDGALGGGMAFEALNHAGHLGTKIVVVLNDNGMAISPSVGAIYGNRAGNGRSVASESTVDVGVFGPSDNPYSAGADADHASPTRVVSETMWQELGFAYLGPVDGHNLAELERALTRARDHETRPTVVHVLTKKGKGYPLAELDPVKYHGVAPRAMGGNSAPPFAAVFGQTVLRLLEKDKRVVVVTPAMLEGAGLTRAARQFPERVFDVGICEQHAVTLAAGLASQGFVPIVAIYSTFLQRAYDQVIHDVCLQGLPVVFAVDRAGLVGDDGKTHHGYFDIGHLRSLPNITVAAPRDADHLRDMLLTAVGAGRPMAVRYPRGKAEGGYSPGDWQWSPIGRGEVLRTGRDVVIAALGPSCRAALAAADLLTAEGIDCAVIDPCYVKPLDGQLILDLASQTKRVVTVEEGTVAGGFGAAVLELLASNRLADVEVECIGLPDRFVEHGSQAVLRADHDLDAKGIARRVKAAFAELAGPAVHLGGVAL